MEAWDEKKRIKKIPLLMVLIIPYISIIILSTVLIWFISSYFSHKAVNAISLELRNEINERINGHLDAFLGTPQLINRMNQAALSMGKLDYRNQSELEIHFLNQIKIFSTVTSIYFGNTFGGLADAGREGSDGKFYVISTDGFTKGTFSKYLVDGNGVRGPVVSVVKDFDASQRTWYLKASDKKEAVWSEPYVLFSGQDMAISSSVPVYDEEENLAGVLGVDLFLSHLGDFLSGLEIGKSGKGFIIDTDGRLIASSTGELPYASGTDGNGWKRISASESSVAELPAALSAITEKFGNLQNIADPGQFDFYLRGKKLLGNVIHIQKDSWPDWLIVTVIPENDFMEPLEEGHHRSLLLMFAAFLAAISAAVIITRKIARRVTVLTGIARSMANGDLESYVNYHSRITELGILTRAFNNMAGKINEIVTGLNNEIAYRKKIEKELEEQKNNLDSFFNVIDDMYFVLNQEGEILWYNFAVVNKLGYRENELIGQNVVMFHPPEFGEEAGKIVLAMLAEESDYSSLPLMTKNGTRIPVETKVFRGKWSGMDVIFGVSKDLSRLKASEEKFVKVFQAGPSLMALTDRESGKFVDVNQLFLQKLGYSRNEILGRTADELGLFADSGQRKAAVEQISVNGFLRNFEVRVRGRNGELFTGIFSAEYIYLQDKILLLTIMNDITDRKILEKKIIQQERLSAIGQVSSGIAHDFNNILTSILGNTELLCDLPDTTAAMHNHLNSIAKSGRRAADLVKQMLDYSQRSYFFKTENIDLADLLYKTFQLPVLQISEGIKTIIDAQPGNFTINADPLQIQQLIINLATNAMDAMPEGGELKITAGEVILPDEVQCVFCHQMINGRWFALEFSDTGTGIPPRALPHIFEPFFTTKSIGKGSGLGLSQVAGIAGTHGGHITIESKYLAGTDITVYLPMNRDSGIMEYAEKEFKNSVLLVAEKDTEPETAGALLEEMGFNVISASDGHRASELYEKNENDICIVISGMVLPDMEWDELFTELRKTSPEVKMIITGSDPPCERGLEFIEEGYVSWERKPLSRQRFSETVSHVLSGLIGRWA